MSLYVLSGKYKGHKLFTPQRKETRPATSLLRKMVFDSCQMHIENARVLDLFSGSGAMGIEALSRGAHFVTFNDMSEMCIEVIKENLKKIHQKTTFEIYKEDAFILLERLKSTPAYDLILLHPPYPIGFPGYVRLITALHKQSHLTHDDTLIFLEIPGQLELQLSPIIAAHFQILKTKSRSTWTLFILKKMPASSMD